MFVAQNVPVEYIGKQSTSYLSEPVAEYRTNDNEYVKALLDQINLLKSENENKQNIIDMFKRGDIVVTSKE